MEDRFKHFRFSANIEEDGDIIKYLEGFPKPLRGKIVTISLRYFLENMRDYAFSKAPDSNPPKKERSEERRNTINLDGLRAIGKQFEGGKE